MRTMILMTGRLHNAKWKKARRHFGIENNPEMVLHHIDPTLKTKDPERYREWRIDDLVVMTNAEHTRLHSKGKTLSEETKNRISENHVGFKGRHHSEETKEKLKTALKGVPKSEEARRNMNAHRAHLRGKDNPNSKRVVCVETGEIYFGAAEAHRLTGISTSGITRCCNKVKYYNSAGGYHWRYLDDTE